MNKFSASLSTGSAAPDIPQRILSRVRFEDGPTRRNMATLNPYAINAFRYSTKNSGRMFESIKLGTQQVRSGQVFPKKLYNIIVLLGSTLHNCCVHM